MDPSPDGQIVTAELVAKTVGGISLIGYAARALQDAGWETNIVANRIVVEKTVEAHLTWSNDLGFWNVFTIDGTLPVWTVGTKDHAEITSWVGCDD